MPKSSSIDNNINIDYVNVHTKWDIASGQYQMGWLIIDYPQSVDNRVCTLNTRLSDFPAWSHPDAGLTSACEPGKKHPKKRLASDAFSGSICIDF